MSDRGKLKIDLACPEGHVAGHLIRQSEHHAIEIELPDMAPEEWPRGGDTMYTHLTCPGCSRRIYGSTEAIREKATWLSDSESGSEGRHTLRFIEDGLA